MPESRLKDGDWKCVAYTDIQRTELTVHIKRRQGRPVRHERQGVVGERKGRIDVRLHEMGRSMGRV